MLSWNLLLYLTMMLPLPANYRQLKCKETFYINSYLLLAIQINPSHFSEGWILPHLLSACPNSSKLLSHRLLDYTGHLTVSWLLFLNLFADANLWICFSSASQTDLTSSKITDWESNGRKAPCLWTAGKPSSLESPQHLRWPQLSRTHPGGSTRPQHTPQSLNVQQRRSQLFCEDLSLFA